MANFTPMTTIQLLQNVPLKPDNEHQLYFDNITAQDNYFTGKLYQSSTNFTYQREHRKIDMQGNYSDIVEKCNYLRYKNANYSNKWYYAFIISIEYVNPNTVRIDYEIDSYQTFLFDLVWKNCYIEREHVSDDSYGANFIDEGLDIGQIRFTSANSPTQLHDSNGNMQMIPVIYMTEAVYYGSKTDGAATANVINNISNLGCIWTPYNSTSGYNINTMTRKTQLFLNLVSSKGKNGAIVGAAMIPLLALNTGESCFEAVRDDEVQDMGYYIYTNSSTPIMQSKGGSISHTVYMPQPAFETYVPANKKLYSYPYYYLIADNNSGSQVIFKPELMKKDSSVQKYINFTIACSLQPDSSVYLIPSQYGAPNDSITVNSNSMTIEIPKLPQIPLSLGYYNNWFAGNFASIVSSIAKPMLNGVAGAISGAQYDGITGSISNSVPSFAEAFGNYIRKYDMQIVPDESVGCVKNTSGSVASRMKFSFYRAQITEQYARQIDNFFTMYGYKVNKLATPQFHTRKYYNYLKLGTIAIYGNIPQEHIDKITNMFKRGITLWHSNDVGNYRSGDNPIL